MAVKIDSNPEWGYVVYNAGEEPPFFAEEAFACRTSTHVDPRVLWRIRVPVRATDEGVEEELDRRGHAHTKALFQTGRAMSQFSRGRWLDHEKALQLMKTGQWRLDEP